MRVTPMPVQLPDARAWRSQLALAALLLTTIALSFGIVLQPWLLIGLVAGAIVLSVAMAAPLALLALMLVLGSVDLSFMTGGFKSLLPHLGGLDMNGIRLVGASAGFSLYIMNAPAGRQAIFARQNVFYILFLTYAFLTLAYSFDRLEGLRLLLKIAYPLLTSLLVVALCDTREKVEKLANFALIAAAVIMFVVTPLYTVRYGFEVDYLGFRRVRGISGTNQLAFYMVAMVLLGFTRLISRKQLRYLLFCAGAAAWIMATMTRIAFLATLIGIGIIALLAALTQKQYRGIVAALVVAAILAVPGLPFILDRSLGFVPSANELLALITHPQALYEAINWQGRTNLWPIVWAGFMASPIRGLGLGSSGVVIREHFPGEAAAVAHNEYLRLGADTGVVGVALFALAMIAWLITALRSTRMPVRDGAEYAMAAAAGIVAWGVIAITDNPFDSYMYFTQYIGFLAGAMMALQHIAAKEQHGDHRLS